MNAKSSAFHPEASIAAARREFGEFGGVNPSIEASTTFTVLKADTLPAMFEGKVTPDNSACYAYGRSFNPTTRALGRLLAALEGTEAGYATASGLSAIAAVIMNLSDAGDAVVSSATVYGGTYALLHDFLPRKAGVRTVFVDTSDMEAVKKALATTPNVKCLYVETLSNPVLAVADIPALADAAHAAGVPLVVDNTFAPCAVTPAKWGADIVVHSLTKGISGASDIVAGAICGTTAFVSSMMDPHAGPLFLLGPVLDAKASSELILRVPHLALRVTEASRRALAYAQALKGEGAKVCYPGLADHPHAATFARLANPGYGAGAVFTVDAGSGGAASRLMERLQNAAGFGLMAVSLGYHETLLSVSGASTSSELSPEDRAAAGITDGLLRVSVGITGTMEQRRASLIAAWRAHVAAEAARAAGAAPGWRAARVQPDPAAPNGISRVASWDSFGDPDEDDGGAGAGGGDALWDGTAATPGDRAAVDLAARMGAKLKVKLGGAKVLYVRSDARAEGA